MNPLERIMYKADVNITAATNLYAGGAGGWMQATQVQQFIKKTTNRSWFLRLIGQEQIATNRLTLSYIDIADRVMRKITTELTPPDATGITTTEQTVNTTYVGLDRVISYQLLDNIIGGRQEADNKISTIFSEAWANNKADLVINGDTASGDPFLSIMDGIYKLCTTNCGSKINTNDYATSTDKFQAMYSALDDDYFFESEAPPAEGNAMSPSLLTNLPNMAFFTTRAIWDAYWDELNLRGTPLGDAIMMGREPLRYKRVPIWPIAKWPTNCILYTRPDNPTVVDQVALMVKAQEQVRKRGYDVAMTGAFGVGFKLYDAAVIGYPQ